MRDAAAVRQSPLAKRFASPSARPSVHCRPTRPPGSVLHTTQNRLREKAFLAEHGFPVTPFRAVRSAADLHAAANQLGCPAVLKTAAFGYDGKGQVKLACVADGEAAVARSPAA